VLWCVSLHLFPRESQSWDCRGFRPWPPPPGLISAVFADEAFLARPRLDERAVGGEVVVTGPARLPAQSYTSRKKSWATSAESNALVVLGKDAVVETALVELPVEKPEPEQIVAELLAKQPFTADAVKGG